MELNIYTADIIKIGVLVVVYLPTLTGLRHEPSFFKQSGLYPNEPLENLPKSEQDK